MDGRPAGEADEGLRLARNPQVAQSRRALAATRRALTVRVTPDAVLGCYEWIMGACFRCSQSDLYVTLLGHIQTPAGAEYELLACGRCVLSLEEERRRYAARRALDYRPGGLGA